MHIILEASLPIQIHAIAALIAIALGGIQLYSPKGTKLHKSLGWIWVSSMVIICLTSFFIYELQIWGQFSPIHLLSLLTLFALFGAIRAAKSGNIQRHKRIMTNLYFLALILTGLFTLAPGRLFHQILFG